MIRQLTRPNTALCESVTALQKSLLNSPLTVKQSHDFVFLCGANKKSGSISARREALLNFSLQNLPNSTFFLAEKVFSELTHFKHDGNFLDIEHNLSLIADFVIIVIESESSLTELGAFSVTNLREKLIVINDSKHDNSSSFINIGPIKAIKEKNPNRVITYKMGPGVDQVDTIGIIFNKLLSILSKPNSSKQINFIDLDPSKQLNKYMVQFLHDIIFMFGPMEYSDIILILKLLFGSSSSYDQVKQLLTLLCALNLVIRKQSFYSSKSAKSTLFKYNHDIASLIARSRLIALSNGSL